MKRVFSKIVSAAFAAVLACLMLFAVGCKEDNPTPTPTPEEVTYTVTFDSNGGTSVASVSVKEGEKVAEPTAPTKLPDSSAEYTFDGWYNGDVAWNFTTDSVTGDMTLTAHWKTSSEYSKETTIK